MKAKDLIKVGLEIEDIYKSIEEDNKQLRHKHIVPFELYVSDEVQRQLLIDGFKLSFDDRCLIIEW